MIYWNGLQMPVEETERVLVDEGQYWQWQVPRYNAGHHYNTPAFGERGNVVIVGHSIWYGQTGIFKPLLEAQVGETLVGENDNGERHPYRITRRWESPYEDGSWLAQPAAPTTSKVILYTCRLDLSALVVIEAELVK